MNRVLLIGRLTKDPELRYTQGSQTAVAHLTVAVDRSAKRDEEKKTDFIRVTVFDRQAETCRRYLAKGRKVAIEGRIQTGSYKDKDGKNIYTTDILADRVEFLDGGQSVDREEKTPRRSNMGRTEPYQMEMPDAFDAVEEEIPF